jgi:hypothetical protein
MLLFKRSLKSREGGMTVTCRAGRAQTGRVPMTLFERVTIVLRGTAFGAAAGAACGALTAGALLFVLNPLGALFVALIGAMFGLVVGIVGGVVFAIAAPRLAGRPRVTRLVGSVLVPGVLIAGRLVWRTAAGRSVVPTADELSAVAWGFFVPTLTGGPVGAFVAPLVLHGPRRARAAADRGTRHRTDGMGADSSG